MCAHHLSRRTLLRGGAGLAMASVLAACSRSGTDTSAPPATSTGPGRPFGFSNPPQQPSSPAQREPSPHVPTGVQLQQRFGGLTPHLWGTDVPGVLQRGAAGETRVALSFDACGGAHGSGVDHALLEVLANQQVAATLFLNQRWIDANLALARQLAANPLFELANHGSRHVPLSVNGRSAYGIAGTASVPEVAEEVLGNVNTLRELTGKPVRWFRSGTAHYDEVAVQVARACDQVPVGFSVNADFGATASAATVQRNVQGVRPADVVLAHMNQPGSGTAAGFAQALPDLQRRGVRFATISQMRLR